MSEKVPLETLERWYVELNCFRWPDDLPFTKPEHFDEPHRQMMSDPKWRTPWEFILGALTEEQQSWAWWKLQLGRTREEWETWWNSRGQRTTERINGART